MRLTSLNICFLDIDGVLNGDESKSEKDFLPEAVQVLNTLDSEYNIKIVLCSSWREWYTFRYIEELFKKNGIRAELIDTTPHYIGKDKRVSFALSDLDHDKAVPPDSGRNAEILKYIKIHDIRRFIILDDYYYSNDFLRSHAIHTDMRYGLTMEYLGKIQEILNNKEGQEYVSI